MSALPVSSFSYLELLDQVRPAYDVADWNINRATAMEQKRIVSVLEHSPQRVVTEDGMAAWGTDKFESEVLGRTVAKVSVALGTGFQTRLAECLQSDYQQASVRLSIEQEKEMESLIEIGFVQVDTIVTYGGAMREHTASNEVRLANADDADRISEISAEAFKDGRYMCDPWISAEEGRNLYGEWGRNAAVGSFGDATFVSGSGPDAFLITQLRSDLPEKCGVFVLLAVAEESRGQGLGAMLVESACSWMARQDCTYLLIGTQLSNVASQRLFSNLGLKEIGRSITMAWGRD